MAVPWFFKLPEHDKLAENENKTTFNFNRDYLYMEELAPTSESSPIGSQYALLQFEKPITCPLGSIIIGSRLDTDINANTCRLAFQGTLLSPLDTEIETELKKIRIYKPKIKEGAIDRVQDPYTAIGKNLFKKETDPNIFTGLKVERNNGSVGKIESSFGKSGKFKIHFPDGGLKETDTGELIHLKFKRYTFDKSKKLYQ